MDWKSIAKILQRSIASCRSQMNRLKKDKNFDFMKPKKTSHFRKIYEQHVDYIRESLKTDPPS